MQNIMQLSERFIYSIMQTEGGWLMIEKKSKWKLLGSHNSLYILNLFDHFLHVYP